MRFAALLFIVLLFPLAGCQSTPPPAAGLSAVRINVVAEPKVGRPAPRVTVYDSPGAAPNDGDFALVDYSDLDDIVIWLEPLSGNAASAPTSPPRLLDIDAGHPTHSLARPLSVGQTLVLSNRGNKTQDFYSVSDGNEFDLGQIPVGREGSYTVKSPGLIEILADTAKDPVAQVYAAPSDWVAMAHSGQSVNFTNVPPGDYRIVSWHPRLPGTQQNIQLTADHISEASIKVGVNSLPKVAPR